MAEEFIKFFPNTKAKSSEVNFNFELTQEQFNQLVTWKDEIDQKIKGNAGFNLFDTKITDHVLEGTDAKGWLLQGSLVTEIYPDAVLAIQKYYNNGLETSYRGITCKQATNKMYIADITQKSAIDKLFEDTGIADFYIWDENNKQFYLPRNKYFHQFTLDTSAVNNFNEAGLPNIEGEFNSGIYTGFADLSSGALYSDKVANTVMDDGADRAWNVKILQLDASLSNQIYGNSDTVQPPTSNKLLYYKVGDQIVNADEIDVAEVLTGFAKLENDTLKKDHSNDTKPYITETYENGTSWYRVWSDGWCEQGGSFSGFTYANTFTISFLKVFKNTNYYFNGSQGSTGANLDSIGTWANKTISSIDMVADSETKTIDWQAIGYIS